jgi:internalin A
VQRNHPEGLRIALERIQIEAEKKTGILNLGGLGLVEPPEELFQLTHLHGLSLGNSDFDHKEEIRYRSKDSVGANHFSDLWNRLRELPLLSKLHLSATDCHDLVPLSGLTSLQSLYCGSTQVSDLGPLSGLTSLQSLYCGYTQVSDLGPLSGLTSLQLLNCGSTQVTDLGPLSGLTSLQMLYFTLTQVSKLGPLSGLTSLQSLDCDWTQVSDLGPLSGLTSLQTLDCSCTQAKSLMPLAGTAKKIYANNLILDDASLETIANRQLEEFYAYHTTIPGIPREVLSNGVGDNCLPRLRAHLEDVKNGTSQSHNVKLILIGNGRTGKTQIARRLRGLEPESDPDSTHGITICSFDLAPTIESELATRIHLWDFGGQDIYHGTHALFMRTNAVFLLVWASTSEASSHHEYRGLTFQNFRLPYWLEHIKHLAGNEQPVLIIQNQCDTARDEAPPQLPDGLLESFRSIQHRHYSALNNRGRGAIDEALREAIADIVARRGKVFIGRGRAAVIAELDEMRKQDESLPSSQRRFQLIGFDAFRALCEKTGGISSVEYFLEYLHDCGLVFYRPGLFDNQIILDQAWALQAIYTVLDRTGPYKALTQLNGRFTRSLLALAPWKEYSEREQQVFLSMMESCGICFKHREEDRELGIEAVYVAPDLLPDREAVASQVASQWDHPGETVRIVCEYSYDDRSLTRSIIASIGRRAKDTAVYWRYGACGYDLESASHFLIDHQTKTTQSSRLLVECKGPGCRSLATQLRKLIEDANTQHGMRDAQWSGDLLDQNGQGIGDRLEISGSVDADVVRAERGEQSRRQHADFGEIGLLKSDGRLKLGRAPSRSEHEHYVSYAWGDDSLEGKARKQAIDDLCDKAKLAGVEIIRDVTHMQVGDRISEFMDRIGGSQRVFVILSQKYLESEFCMYELWSIWKNCQQDPDRFLSRIRVHKLPCAKISKAADNLRCAAYWAKQKQEIDEIIKETGIGIVGETVLKKYKCMQDFVAQTSEMLSLIADVLKPQDFDTLLERGFA